MTNDEVIDCRSEEGVTIGLIDAIITQARILRRRQFDAYHIREALKDLRSDEDLQWLLEKAGTIDE